MKTLFHLRLKVLFTLIFLIIGNTVIFAQTFYSQGTDNFSTLINWDTNPGGGGTDPVAGDLVSGSATWIIQTGHVITLDQNIDVASIQITGGTLSHAANSIAAAGGASTFSMTSGIYSIGISPFPNVFETITLSGGTINYSGAAQDIAHQDADGDPIQYNNLTVSGSGIKTFTGALDINGTFTIDANVNITTGNFTHTVAGGWIQNGNASYTLGSSTIDFDGGGFLQINNPVNGDPIEFNNLTVSGGGVLSIGSGSTVRVYSNFTATGSSNVQSASNLFVEGNFSIAGGSNYTQTGGVLEFEGTGNQNIDVRNTTLTNLYFDNGAPNTKIITGDITTSNQLIIYNDAIVDDAAGGQTHTIGGTLRIDGVTNWSGEIITNGQIQDNDDNAITLGTANLTANGGSIETNDALTLNGDFTVNSGTFNVEDGSSIIGNGAGDTFTLVAGASLDVEGPDNFPSNFTTYTISPSSRILYTRNGNQTVRGGFTMGELELGAGGVKTLDGPVTITTFLDLNNGITLNLGAFTHTIGDRIYNATGSTVISSGTVNLLVSDGANYELIDQGTYTFNNLTVNSTSLTGSFIFDVSSTLTVNGDFTVNNAGGSALNRLILDLNDLQVNNDLGNTWTIGQHVEIRTSGATSFNSSVNSFAAMTVSPLSFIHYNGGINQTISAGFTYGGILLNGSGNKTAGAALDINGVFERAGGNPIFVDAGFTHTVAGNWQLASAYYTNPTGTIVFDGGNQIIEASAGAGGTARFNNVTFGGTGTKTLDENFDINGNLVIDPGVTVDASSNDVDFAIARAWTDNGTFTQTNGTTTFDGTFGNQNLAMGASSTFGNVNINKPSGTRRVTATTDIRVSLDFAVQASNEFRYNNFDLYIGEDLTINTGATWTQNASSTLYFNGTNLQNLNINAGSFTNVDFSGGGTKNILDALDVNGNWTIQNGATVDGNGNELSISGNWTNNGSFQHVNQVVFDGANQTINASSFNRIVVGGTNTKTLGGGITVTDDVTINASVTLDVSGSNYSVTVGDDWTNAGTFNARSGIVTFNGNAGLLDAGGSAFYNLNINKNVGQNQQLRSNIVVNNDLTIQSGELETDGFNITIGGTLAVSDLLDVNNATTIITFTSTGAETISTNGNSLREIIFTAPGATYSLQDNLTLQNNYNLTINSGTLSLNGNQLVLGGTGAIAINGGGLDIDDNAILQLPNNSSLTNSGGTLSIVGSAGNPGRITSTGGYTITQTLGTFAAQYYEILNTNGNGVTISGGTIDATNNFSNGKFENGAGNQYLQLSGLNFADVTADNVVFETGPTNNVTRTSGTGVITFEDPTGTLAGAAYENDGGALIEWTFPGGVFWDGGGDGTSWSDDLNWSGNTQPTPSSNVQLNHDFNAAAYTVNVNAANEVANRISMDTGGGNPIGLTISGGFDLAVSDIFTMGASTTLTINNATSELQIAGSFTNASGTIAHSAGTILFNGTSGSHSINPGGQSFYDFQVNAPGATYSLSGALDVNNDITLTDGTLDVSASNFAVTVGGDWSNVGLTTFQGRSGTVTFDLGGNSTQTIQGGPFYNFVTNNSTGIGTAIKQLTGNVDVNNRLTISANTQLDAQTFNLFVGEDWINNAATTAFTNTGTGTVTFDGTGTQELDNGSFATTFNNITINVNGNVNLQNNSTINGNVQVSSSVGTFNLQTFTLTGAGGSNVLTVSGGSTLNLLNSNFPSTFETIILASNSTVEYGGNGNETVFATTYGNLRLERLNSGTNTKTLAGDIVVQGFLDIDDTFTTLDVNGHTITLTGNLDMPGGGQPIQWNNGSLIHNGVNFEFDADITEFHNVTLSGSGNKDLNGNVNITGNFTVQSPVVFRMYDRVMTATGVGVQTFNLDNGAQLQSTLPTASGAAFPQSFDNYGIGSTSTVTLNGNVPQTILTSPTYGNLAFTGGSTVTLDGNLDVDGDFDNNNVVIADAGFNMNFGGSTIILNSQAPTGGTTITFDGTTQDIYEDATNLLTFENVVFAGTGTKTFTQGGDDLDVNGTITINSGVTVVSSQDINYSGATFSNSGTFTHTANIFSFDRAGAQTINPGANNTFNAVTFAGGGTKTFSTNGTDINGNITINLGTTVDLGSLTHTFGYNGANFLINGTLTSANANIILDGPNPDLPGISVNDLTIATTGQVDLLGNLDVNGNLTINAGGAQLDVEAANYDINVGGNFTNNGVFDDRNATVTFDGSSSPITITSNGDQFYDVVFSPSAPVTYTLQSATNTVARSMIVGANATLDLNSQDLTLGSNIGAGKSYTINGTLEVDQNATLTFDNQGSATTMTVGGSFSLVGTSGNIATLTAVNVANNRRPALSILGTGTVAARHYQIEYLDNNGFVLSSGATVDATDNFSDGTWANMVTAAGGPYYYLQTNDVAFANPVQNVNFSFALTPTVGVHYNVQRSGAAANMTFSGSISGTLSGAAYEDDAGSRITWPPLTAATWTGAVDSDWHTAGNWSPAGVPLSTTDVTIPLTANNPTISTGNAEAQNLEITNGALTVSGNFDLDVNGNLTIGTGANAGALVISTSGSVLNVSGNFTRGTNGIFSSGSGSVIFDAPGGSVTILPRNSAFNDVEFNGDAIFVLTGDMDINGDLTLTLGTLDPGTNNYNITLAGDYAITGGSFDTGTNGTITLDGAAQAITNAIFDNLTLSGSGNKTFTGAHVINDDVIINSTLVTAAAATLDVAGDFTIAASGTFSDVGPGTTNVGGPTWNNSGTYSGTGTIIFDGGNQTINASPFHNITLAGTGVKYLGGNITVANNMTLENTFTRFETNTFTTMGTGTGVFSVADGQTIWVESTNNFPSSFGTYTMGPISVTDYRSTGNQTIRGGVSYGNLNLINANTKTLGGNITIQTDLDINESTLDVSTNNYTIFIGDDWINNDTGSFVARVGDVVFNGAADQQIRKSPTGTKTFYKITVDKPSGELQFLDENHEISDNLIVSDGDVDLNGLQVTIGGGLDVTGGNILTNGTIVLNSTAGAENIRTNGSVFNNLTFNGSGTTFTLLDELNLNGDFTLTAGTFNGNGNTVNLGNGGADIVSIGSTYQVGANGTLALGNTVNVTVSPSGTLELIGSAGNPATLTARTAGQTYAFQVNGTIAAQNYLVEYVDANGIVINSGATIDATNNFSNGTFANGTTGGTFLRIENTQTLTINNVTFSDNPGGNASNVTKVVAASGTLTFDDASGVFAGELYDDDPNNLIDWPTPVELTWIGGIDSDWYTAGNWSANIGPDQVPTGAENVIIATAVNQPIIDTDGALTNNLTINTGAILVLNTPSDPAKDIQINGNLTLNGTLTLNGINDSVYVAGGWDRGIAGVFNNGNSAVVFNGASGTHLIDNGSSQFYDVIIDATAGYILDSQLLVTRNLEVEQGTLDVSGGNNAIQVGGNWIMNGAFTSRSGTVTLNRSTAGTATLNSGGHDFYNLVISAGASTIYSISTNNVTADNSVSISSGTLDLNSNDLIFGDNAGTDILSITGALEVDANASLRLGNGSQVQVNSGGNIRIVGSDISNVGTVTRQSTGTYGFVVSSGGEIDAQYYAFEFMNTTGIQVSSGATIDATNNFSNGSFSNGASGGRYLNIVGLTSNVTPVVDVTFNAGPTINVRATSGSGNYIEFEDASGLLAGPIYEDDDAAATTGAVRWYSTSSNYTWTGAINTDWHTVGNWDDGIGVPPTPPTSAVNVIIPNVANDPIISSSDAAGNDLTLASGAVLTINTNRNLVLNASYNSAGTLTIPDGSNSNVTVALNFANSGTLNFGNASTLTLTAPSGNRSIQTGGSSLNNLTLNGGATFQLTSNLDINGDLTITTGTLDITASNYQITVGGDWTNNGSFTARTGRVIFDGSTAQNIDAGGTAATKRFYNMRIAKSNTATLTGDIYVANNLELNSGSLNLGSQSITVIRDWNNTGVAVTPATSTVILEGANSPLLRTNGQAFNNLTVNKTGVNQVSLSSNAEVNGTLTVTAGTLFLNGRTLDFGDGSDNINITGVVNVDAGSALRLHENASATVNVGGSIQIVGSSASSLATMTSRTGNAGWTMNVNGTIGARFAQILFTGGNGVSVSSSGTVNATNNFSFTSFDEGIGNAYLTINNNQTFTATNTTFDQGAAPPTYNVQTSTGSGVYTFSNFTGTHSGDGFENDPDPDPGRIRWNATGTFTPITVSSTYIVGNNDFTFTVTSIITPVTSVSVDYNAAEITDIGGSDFFSLARYFRVATVGGTFVADVTARYRDSEVMAAGFDESDLRLWLRTADDQFALLSGSGDIDPVNNIITVSGVTFGNGTLPKAGPQQSPVLMDGNDQFFFSNTEDSQALPIELASFEVVVPQNQSNKPELVWTTATERENYGFDLLRLKHAHDSTLGLEYEKIAFIEGAGTTTEPQAYSFTDHTIDEATTYAYKLRQYDYDGDFEDFGPWIIEILPPETTQIKENYPNPFNPITTIPFEIAQQGEVQIQVFDILGRMVQTLKNERMNPGTYSVSFDGTRYASGIYLIRMATGGKLLIRRMTLVK